MRNFLILLALAASTQPARAQFYYDAPDFRGLPLTPGEPGIGIPLPGATPEEERANWAWQMRAGLNVAALQCKFDRTLQTTDSYGVVLMNHSEELDRVYKTLTAYFKRTSATPKAAQAALDRYGTRTYSEFSTVRAQLGFCQTASGIARAMRFAPRGSFTAVTVERLRELRNSLIVGGEQHFRFAGPQMSFAYPDWGKKCWDRRDVYKQICGLIA